MTFWLKSAVLILFPIVAMLAVWISPLSFVPVPWPDDSAFYFVAKDLFQWPPRWVMLPQAPFEPTYRIFNFNTMPLYPVLIGLGRLIGIDGSFALKIWPLTAWALSGSLLLWVLFRRGLPFIVTLAVGLVFMADPVMRWASVLIRPESLIALFGMAIVLGMTYGFPERLKPRGLWDPIAALLALAAYAHFNAIHLLFPVVFYFAFQPRRLFEIGSRTALYLLPWAVAVLFHIKLFIQQMTTQWSRLNIPNHWLDSLPNALASLFQNLGSPTAWPRYILYAGGVMWALLLIAVVIGLLFPFFNRIWDTAVALRSQHPRPETPPKAISESFGWGLVPAGGWVLGAAWLWHTKPEVWFVFYLHVAIWTFAGVALTSLWRKRAYALFIPAAVIVAATGSLFLQVNVSQARKLARESSWTWARYQDFVQCVDTQLTKLERKTGKQGGLHVWCPTFPDITIELSRRHPHWHLTRTNDFNDRAALAIQHGHDVDAVVVTETIRNEEREINAPADDHPFVTSLWMTWKPYFLYNLWVDPDWKQNRWICQTGRWQAFLFMEPTDGNPKPKRATHPIFGPALPADPEELSNAN